MLEEIYYIPANSQDELLKLIKRLGFKKVGEEKYSILGMEYTIAVMTDDDHDPACPDIWMCIPTEHLRFE